MGGKNSCEISRLPEDCLSHVISLTSPRDACRCSTVCRAFQSSADADVVWEHFLPSDIAHILSTAVDQPVLASKKDFYFHLCNHGILIDDGKMSLRLDRSSGAKICMLSATKGVTISWRDNPQYWQRVPNPDSVFSEVAQLMLVWWFLTEVVFGCRNLSSKTSYAAYFVFKLSEDSSGFDLPINAILRCGDQDHQYKVCLQLRDGATRQNTIRYPIVRDDGWLEVKIGEFYNEGGEDDVVETIVAEIDGLWAKRGLLYYGIEFRPNI